LDSPQEHVRQHKLGWQSYANGDLRSAWRICQSLNRSAPGFSPGWDLASRVALGAGDASAGLRLAEQALALNQSNYPYVAQKASCLLALNRVADARVLIESLASRPPETAAQYDTLGNLYTQSKDQGRAQACFEKAVEREPDKAHYNANLALSLQANGDLDRAEQAFDRSIALNPADHEAWLHRSRLRKQQADSNHVAALTARIAQGCGSWRSEMTLHYALAKEYEDLGDYPHSFSHLQKGASLRRSHMEHDSQADLDAMQAIAYHFSANYLQTSAPASDSAEPIFIVGLPRTGTTLVERILGSHSQVFAAGELNNFAENLTRQVLALNNAKPTNREQFIEAATRIDYAALGEAYIDSTRPHTGDKPHFVDKLPLNFLYCGLILKALPNARIVHLTRNPMDTCFAVYKTLFKQAYPFSYDLKELGHYYLAYRQLMRHWHEAMPGRILDVSYEQLTSRLEHECRSLISYCGLPWENDCLNFHNNAAPSMTASLAQVRQPVYTSSIGRWLNYRAELRPLEAMLTQAGLDLEMASIPM
jgi:tetratricopeptide (TPR) repeat protein